MKFSAKKSVLRNRQLRIESLEIRELLSANPLLPPLTPPLAAESPIEQIAPAEPQAAIPSNANAADTAWLNNFLAAHTGLTDSIATWTNGRITGLDLYYKGLTGTLDVSGLTALTTLNCGYNSLSVLDVSKNTALTTLNCGRNNLSVLDVSKNTALTYLSCGDNNLSVLDVSKNTALTILYCGANKLSVLDVSKNTALTTLDCSYINNISVLDVSKNTALTSLECVDTDLSVLDVSKNTALTTLWCYDNNLSVLDVSKNTALTYLNCDRNNLWVLDVSKNTALTTLYCDGNNLSVLDVSENTVLTYLGCGTNYLSVLDVSKNTKLTTLWCDNNGMKLLYLPKTVSSFGSNISYTDGNPGINVFVGSPVSDDTAWLNNFLAAHTGLTDSIATWTNGKITSLNLYNKGLTGTLDVSGLTALTNLDCRKNYLSVLDVSKNTKLTWLQCDNNGMERLYLPKAVGSFSNISYTSGNPGIEVFVGSPVSDDTAWLNHFLAVHTGLTSGIATWTNGRITGLNLYNKGLTSTLDVSGLTALTYLSCWNNNLSVLDVSKNTALKELSCDGNNLSVLDVSKNTALTYLSCGDNNLSVLDVSKNTALTYLSCGDNNLSVLDVSKNTALTQLYCSANNLSVLDVSKNTVLTELICRDNNLSVLDVSKNTKLTTLWCDNNGMKLLYLPKAVGSFSDISYTSGNPGIEVFVGTSVLPTTPTVTIAPTTQTVTAGTSVTLTATAGNYNGTPSYSWQYSTNGSAWYAISTSTFSDDSSSVTSSTYTPSTSATGTRYYRCVVTNTTTGGSAPGASNSATVTVNPAPVLPTTPTVTITPTTQTPTQGTPATAISATVSNCNGTPSYSWQYSTNGSTWNTISTSTFSDDSSSVTSSTYTPSTSTAGTRYYRCVVTNTTTGGSAQGTSNSATVTVNPVDNDTAWLNNFLAAHTGLTSSIATWTNGRITGLNLYNKGLTGTLDVSGLTALTSLSCSQNDLSVLDVSKNTALTILSCYNNNLSVLDVSKNTELTYLDCYNNSLWVLDVSKNTALAYLNCYGNNLSVLDVSKNTELTQLLCYDNKLSVLDVSKNIALTYLDCYNNGMKRLYLPKAVGSFSGISYTSGNPGIEVFIGSPLTTPTLSTGTVTANSVALSWASVANASSYTLQRSTSSTFSSYITLTSGSTGRTYTDTDVIPGTTYYYRVKAVGTGSYADSEYSTTVTVTPVNNDTAWLNNFLAAHTGLTSGIATWTNGRITGLNLDSKGLTGTLDVSGVTALKELYCGWNNLSVLDISKNTALTYLDCGWSNLSVLDVSKNTALTYLYCGENNLSVLDVSKNTALTYLDCWNNSLPVLDVSKNTALTYLNCWYNNLSVLDISKNTALTYLDCGWNNLSVLDVSKNTALTYLGCSGNQLTSLDISGCTELKFLDCRENNQTTVYVPIGYAGICNKDEGVELIEKAAPVTKPTAPKNLTAKVLPMSNGKLPVQINWDAASNATHYILHRWEEGDYKADGKTKNWKVIYAMKPAEQIPSGGTLSTFQVINSDVSKVTAKQVQYLVRGYNGDVPGESVNIFVTLNNTPVIPTAPKNLTAKVLPMSNGKLPVQINWNAAAGATHYILHRWEEGDYKADGKTKNWKVIYAMKPAGQIPSGGLLSDFQVINSDVSKVTAKQVQYLVRGYNGDVPGESASVFVTVN